MSQEAIGKEAPIKDDKLDNMLHCSIWNWKQSPMFWESTGRSAETQGEAVIINADSQLPRLQNYPDDEPLWVSLWGIILSRLSEVGRPTLEEDGIIPWTWVLHWKKKKKEEE